MATPSAAGSKASLFETQATDYSKFRLTYPPELYAELLDFCGPTPRELAIDVAAGSGQASRALAEHFHRVVALDANYEQLRNAPAIPNATFKHGLAEQTGLPSGCADLVAVAQALHWFDVRAFYAEAARVLAPHGTLAAWCYGVCCFDVPAADTALQHFFSGTLGPYWDERRVHIEQGYTGLEPQAYEFGVMERRALEMHNTATFASFMGYLGTWSAYATYRQQHQDLPDPMIDLRARLEGALGVESDEQLVTTRVPVTLLLAKQPVKS